MQSQDDACSLYTRIARLSAISVLGVLSDKRLRIQYFAAIVSAFVYTLLEFWAHWHRFVHKLEPPVHNIITHCSFTIRKLIDTCIYDQKFEPVYHLLCQVVPRDNNPLVLIEHPWVFAHYLQMAAVYGARLVLGCSVHPMRAVAICLPSSNRSALHSHSY